MRKKGKEIVMYTVQWYSMKSRDPSYYRSSEKSRGCDGIHNAFSHWRAKQRKVTERWGVKNGANQQVLLQCWGAGHYFLILKGHNRGFC